ncbi:MAG TPA: hypothetical protein VFU15_05880, partial [Bacteroidia bacterium]|nr:hypothetical protein [Bacteroidia bacterium]
MRIFTRERLIALGLFFVFLFGMTQFSRKMHYAVGMGTCIWSDGIGYYEYLPALFIRHDVNHIGWGMPLPNGNRFDKYATGVAILETPFFLAADAATVLNHRERTGFSSYYGYGVLFADLFYTFAGFIFLFYTLRKWFSLRTVFFSIILIALGTNLFYYGFAEPSMSHAYSFFAFAGFLFYCRKFHEEGRRSRHLHAVGFFLGLATAIRPTSIVIGIFFLLYGVYSGKDFRERLKTFFSDRRIIPALLFWGVLLFLPQMLYWHSTTGKWFTYSYGYYDEGFTYWKSPHFFDVLFGPWCSWIPYTPVMIFFFP